MWLSTRVAHAAQSPSFAAGAQHARASTPPPPSFFSCCLYVFFHSNPRAHRQQQRRVGHMRSRREGAGHCSRRSGVLLRLLFAPRDAGRGKQAAVGGACEERSPPLASLTRSRTRTCSICYKISRRGSNCYEISQREAAARTPCCFRSDQGRRGSRLPGTGLAAAMPKGGLKATSSTGFKRSSAPPLPFQRGSVGRSLAGSSIRRFQFPER